MKRLVFIDFDGTLFNVKSFASKMAHIFERYGGLDFFNTLPRTKFGSYCLEKHLFLIKTKTQRNKVKRELKDLFRQSSEYLFPDAIDFLRTLGRIGSNTLILISKGERVYQD